MPTKPFEIQSDAVSHGILSDEYGINNTANLMEGVPTVSFPLDWKNPPDNTVSFSLIFVDFDNVEDEGVPWIHWLVADIPRDISGLPKNASRSNPKLIQGNNSWALPYGPYAGTSRDVISHYGGPAPASPHEYECTLYALDCFLELKSGFYLNQLRKAMEGHVLSKATLKSKYIPNIQE